MNRRFNLAENAPIEEAPPPRMGFSFFFVMMLAFPVQYYISDQYGVAVGPRDENAFSLMKDTTSFVKKYLTPSAITKNINNINNILEDYVERLEQNKLSKRKKKNALHSSEGESPAHEIYAFNGQNKGYFGHSSRVRHRNLGGKVEYYVGQVFKHKKYDYYGVIVGWDSKCTAPDPWKKRELGSNWRKIEQQPFYSVLTDKGDSRYVAQENIQLVGGEFKLTKVRTAAGKINESNPSVQDYFDYYDEETQSFYPRPAIRIIYPDD